MRLGNKLFHIIITLFFFGSSSANEKITTTPLLNLNEIKPSFEEIDDKTDVLFVLNCSKCCEKASFFVILPGEITKSYQKPPPGTPGSSKNPWPRWVSWWGFPTGIGCTT